MLEQAGYEVISDASQADIIIAHSGGCFALPDHVRARKIVLVGITYWPGRSLAGSMVRKVIDDLHEHHREGELRFWLQKSWFNLLYAFRITQGLCMLRGRHDGRVWRYGKQVVVVRYSHDTFCTPDLGTLPFTDPPKIVQLPGHHDDCWRKPAAIVRIVQS